MTWKLDAQHKPTHNSYTLYYHIVFVTRKRDPLINREIADFLKQFFRDKCEDLEVHLLEHEILCDHVHLVLSLRPTHYIPEVTNFLKGVASHEANQYHEFVNMLYWMRGYHIDTISARSLEQAKEYVRGQYHAAVEQAALENAIQHRLFQAGAAYQTAPWRCGPNV